MSAGYWDLRATFSVGFISDCLPVRGRAAVFNPTPRIQPAAKQPGRGGCRESAVPRHRGDCYPFSSLCAEGWGGK